MFIILNFIYFLIGKRKSIKEMGRMEFIYVNEKERLVVISAIAEMANKIEVSFF